MKHIKQYEQKNFEWVPEEEPKMPEKLEPYEAYAKYIVGQKAVGIFDYSYYDDKQKPKGFHGQGIKFENGYSYVSYGRGCSGMDCNTAWVIDPLNNIVSIEELGGI